jgi:hypothetical protein
MRAILPTIATLAILCAACSDTTASPSSPTSDTNREAVASVVGGVSYPLVAITPPVTALKPSDSANVQAKLSDANGSWTGQYITWKSSDPTVLQVTTTNTGSTSGSVAHIKALKVGTATITATTLSKTSDTRTVAVSLNAQSSGDTVVAKVTVTPNPLTIASGKTFQLTAKALNAAGTAIPNARLTYRTTNAAFLTVSSSGVVTGVSKGTANVEAAATNGKMAWSTVTDTGTALVVGPGTGKGVNAVWSDKFVSSVGIGTHFSYWDLLPYGNNVNSTLSSLKAAGFRFVRDGLFVDTNRGSNDRFYGVMNQVKAAGIKLVLVTQPAYLGNNQFVKTPYANQSNLDTAVTRLGAGAILAFEGPNEVDNNNGNWGGIPAFGANAKAYQAAMYRHAKQIAPSVTVIGLTTTSAWGASYVGDISSYMDAGTLHPYPSASVPTAFLGSMENALAPLNGAHKGWWVTETGYYTAPHATQNVYQPGVSEAAQAKYAPRLYLDYFNAGISHTSIYELIDEHFTQSDAEANYGLLRNDGSPKPAYNAIKNLIGLLSDPGPAFTPTTSLSYTLSGTTGTVRQALFQKRDGRFYLALWNDVSVYNTSGKTDVNNAAVPVAVTFATQPRSVTRFQPTAGSAGTSVPAAKTVAVSVLDNPVILEITP